MKKILITGIGGNVGQYIANEMFHAGYDVVGIYRNIMPKSADYELIRADISKKLPKLQGIDAVIHIAARLTGTVKELINDNIKATEKLIYFAEQVYVKRFIYISTVSVYGSVEGELCENSVVVNPEPYGMTKYLSECLIRESIIPEKLIIQLPRMLGPFVDLENTKGSGFLTMAKKILMGEDVICFIPEVKYNNYLHVSELEKFIEQIFTIDKWTQNKTILLGVQEQLTMLKILQIMKNAIGSKSKIIANSNGIVPKCSLINICKAKELGFSPCSAENMLERFIQEVKRIEK